MSEKVKPQHFYTDTPPERIIGTECEYTVQQHRLLDDLIPLDTYISDAAITAAGYESLTEFLSNGSRLYADGDTIEYATPECLGPRQAAAADIAGITVVRDVVAKSGEIHHGIYRYASADVMPRLERQSRMHRKTTGYHENFLIPRSAVNDTFTAIMPAHVVSRIWAMGGLLASGGFRFSQKVSGIGGNPINIGVGTHRLTEHQKPMITIPSARDDYDVVSDPEWARVEIRYADPGMSPTMRYASFAATSLVLRLVEHAERLGLQDRVEAVRLKDPVAAAHQLTDSLSLKKCVYTVENQLVTALDISEMLAMQADQLSRYVELPEDEVVAIPLWFDIIDGLRATKPHKGEYGEFVKISDFAAKHHRLLARNQGAKLTSRSTVQIAQSTNWDRIDKEGTGLKWWDYFGSQHVPKSLIDTYVTEAPATRAALRAFTIINHDGDLESIDWAAITVKDGARYIVSDPYGK